MTTRLDVLDSAAVAERNFYLLIEFKNNFYAETALKLCAALKRKKYCMHTIKIDDLFKHPCYIR